MGLLKATFLSIFLYSVAIFSQQPHLTKIVNIAAKQRMLVQRLAKDKVYIKIKKNKEFAKSEMQTTIETFERGIKTLKNFAPNKEVSHKVSLVEFSYDVYKKMILDKSKNSMDEVIKYNTLFLNTCDDLLTELLKYSKSISSQDGNKGEQYILSNVSKATAASGKLRYLTQRLNLYYALNSHNFTKVAPEQINNIVRNMDKNLNYLTVLEFNTMQIDDSLSEVIYYLDSLKKLIYTDGVLNMNANITSEQLFELCNTVLSKANTTTQMYADLGKGLQNKNLAASF